MSNFNFGILSSTPTTSVSYLKPYDIYDNVKVDSVEIKSGTSNKGNNWKCLRITFKCDKGIHIESIWYPKEGDDVRREVEMPNGGKKVFCSNFEVTMAMIAAIGNAFNPEGFQKMKELSSKFKSFDDVVTALKSILDKAKDKETSMKLVGQVSNNSVYARLPQPIALNKSKDSDEWYTFSVPIFGENLTFSDYEIKQRDKYLSAKATDMESRKEMEQNVDSAPSDDIDFESLL